MTKEEKAKYQRDWSRNNPEKVKANRASSYRRLHPEVKRKSLGTRRPNGSSQTIKERNLWKRFGITLEQYRHMVEVQKNLCAICLRPERRQQKGKVQGLSVDHDHSTNEVRELLCSDCNTAIGLFGEDILRLQAAVAYLLKHKGQ